MYNTSRTRRNGMQVGAGFDSGGNGCPAPPLQEKTEPPSRQRLSAPLPQVTSLLEKSCTSSPSGSGLEEEASGRDSKRLRAVEDLALVDQPNGESTKGRDSLQSKKEQQNTASVERPNSDLHRAQSMDSANVGERMPLRGSLRARTIGVVSEGSECGALASCVRSSSRHSTAQSQGTVGQDEEPHRREASVQRRVSVAIRPDILGELPAQPSTGRSKGRRVTLSMVDETTEDLRNTLQKKADEIPDARLPCDTQRKFPKEGREMLPPLNQIRLVEASVSSGGASDDEGRASRGDISADLQQLRGALRNIIPSGRELEDAKRNATSMSAHSTAAGSGASTSSTKSSARTPRQNPASCGVQPRTPKSARQRSSHRHCLEELPESGELANITPSSRLESKFKVCSNSLADELARLDTKCSDGVLAGNANHRGGEISSAFGRIGDPTNIHRRAHRLFTR
mmetsp:Transcript_100234/g.157981  ORF Transcript_100234/g.157981 Transcript_100234/m.157981 type:complete len:455 (+) Transcript_100234:65-1429(+)